MNAYHRYKNRLERFLQTERGKRFINFAYSIGAAIVILGAMFKLLSFPFANEMLFIGMVTECIVFILSAFDTPIRDYRWEQVFPALTSNTSPESAAHTPSQTSILTASSPNQSTPEKKDPYIENRSTNAQETLSQSSMISQEIASHTEEYGKQIENLNRTLSGLNSIYELQLKSVSSQIGAIEQINQGLSRLKGLYGETLPEGSVIKEETEKMALQLKELNEVYARMLEAMTVNSNPVRPDSLDNHPTPSHTPKA